MAAKNNELDGRMWDVAIVGSGPAGSSAALAALRAAPKAAVLLLDRSDFPRDKCCGDGVLNRAGIELGDYGLPASTLFAGYESVQQLRLISASGSSVGGNLPTPMTVIPRYVFDDRLVTAAREAGATWVRHSVRQVRDRGSFVELDGSIRARVVIGADGAESVVRRAVQRDGSRARDLAVALRGYDTADGSATPTMVFERDGGLSYAWRFPCSNGPANVGYGHLLSHGQKASRGALLSSLQRLLPDVRPDPKSLRAHRLPLATGRQALARGRLLLAGDAASLINPLSGEGVYYAVASGLTAGNAAVTSSHEASRRYEVALRRRFGSHLRHAATLAMAVQLPGVLEAGLLATGANAGAFADVAELGLSDGKVTGRLAVALVRQLVAARIGRRA